MMKGAVSFLALLLVLGAAAAAVASVSARTSLTITGKALGTRLAGVSGSLKSPAPTCVRNRKIGLYLVQKPKPLLLGTTRTSSAGRYTFRVKTTRRVVVYARFAGAFYSSYAGQQKCSATTSKWLALAPRRH